MRRQRKCLFCNSFVGGSAHSVSAHDVTFLICDSCDEMIKKLVTDDRKQRLLQIEEEAYAFRMGTIRADKEATR